MIASINGNRGGYVRLIEEPKVQDNWNEKSPQCKKDLIVKKVALAALVVLCAATVAAGILSLMATPGCVLGVALLTAGSMFLLILPLLFLAAVDMRSYHRQEVAAEVCEEIKGIDLRKMPNHFTFQLPTLEKYGFISEKSRDKMVELLKKNSKLRMKLFVKKHSTCTSKETTEATQSLEKQINDLSADWSTLMNETVTPGLPF